MQALFLVHKLFQGTEEGGMRLIEVQGEMVEAQILHDVSDVQAEIVTSG